MGGSWCWTKSHLKLYSAQIFGFLMKKKHSIFFLKLCWFGCSVIMLATIWKSILLANGVVIMLHLNNLICCLSLWKKCKVHSATKGTAFIYFQDQFELQSWLTSLRRRRVEILRWSDERYFFLDRYNELQDPTYQYKIDIGHFMVRKHRMLKI